MPMLGFGSLGVDDVTDYNQSMQAAWDAGYRLFDTASSYGNQTKIGEYFAQSGLERNSYWLTSKVAQDEQGYEETLAGFSKTIKELQTDYLDLYLIHWPKQKTFFETWKALEHLYNEGLVRAIGVSNFEANHLDRLLTQANIVPAVDQIETHPYFNNHITHRYLEELGIQHQAWSPLGHGGQELNDPLIADIAEKHGKSAGQIILRFLFQSGVASIPKSTNPARMKQNIEIFDFQLSAFEMTQLQLLQTGERVMGAPDENYIEDKW
jgi:diketogulonate reductase-like aldo/keto reductase